MLGYAELLRTRRLEPAAREEILGTVHREAKRLSALIDDFLDVQAIEQDRLRAGARAVLGRRAARTSRCARSRARARRTGWSSSPCDVAALTASATAARIAQVVANLLSNAIKYSPDGGAGATSARAALHGVVLVAVTDEGLGIPAAEQPHVFEKFFRVERGPAARAWAGPGSVWLWRTRSWSRTAARWASRAPRARARASGSQLPTE